MERKNLFVILVVIFFGCQKDAPQHDAFLVSKHSIGLLTNSTKVSELKFVFSQDSITKYIGGDEFTGDINDFEVFDKTGKLLLALTPREDLDSTSTIKSIKVVSPRYKTKKGLNTNSIYKEIKDNYTISSIQNTLRNIIVSVDEINAYFTIDKRQLPKHLQFDMNAEIGIEDIPDNARIKNFFLQWL